MDPVLDHRSAVVTVVFALTGGTGISPVLPIRGSACENLRGAGKIEFRLTFLL
jgi:hypothetical protein